MAKITDSGVEKTTLEEYVVLLEGAFKRAFGEQIDLDSETPQGQIIGVIALSMSQSDDALVSEASASDIDQAYNTQLDGIANVLGVSRKSAERSVVNVALTGVPATIVPSGTRAQTDSGDLFLLDDDVKLDATGYATATMYSIETGSVSADIGELNKVVDVVPGWETITNTTEAILGRDEETDTPYRARYKSQREKNALTTIDSVIGAIKEIEGVSDVIGHDNDTSSAVTIQNFTIDPHSIALFVDGGGGSEIAEAIYNKKTGGTGTTGGTVIPVQDSKGFYVDVSFTRPAYVPFALDLTIKLNSSFPGDGIALLKERIMAYIDGSLSINDGEMFEADGISIGESLLKYRLFTPINSIPGHEVRSITLRLKGGVDSLDVIDVDLDQRVALESLDDITITVEA